MKRILIIGSIFVLAAAIVIMAFLGFNHRKSVSSGLNIYEEGLKLAEEGKKQEALESFNKIVVDFSSSEAADEALLNMAKIKLENDELLEAKKLLKMALTLYPSSNSIEEIKSLLWDVNIKILFSPVVTEDSIEYEVVKGDTLYGIAKKFNTTIDLIQKSSQIKNFIIVPGQKLKISDAKFTVLVDKCENILTLKSSEEILKVYKVSTGVNNSTPAGTFKIISKLTDPVWYKNGAVVAAESPDNVLGTRWMGISVKGYGIHGTMQSETIGGQVTEGCVRMYNSDVEELYSILPVGAEVTIADSIEEEQKQNPNAEEVN